MTRGSGCRWKGFLSSSCQFIDVPADTVEELRDPAPVGGEDGDQEVTNVAMSVAPLSGEVMSLENPGVEVRTEPRS
jgi:hypothetical protein